MQLIWAQNSATNVLDTNCQLLKWIGNKQRFAREIISNFPDRFNRYFEPFLGSGAVLASLWPEKGIGSDLFPPLIDIFETLRNDPNLLVHWYETRIDLERKIGKKEAYSRILADFNSKNNGADFLYLSRACYGGVIRFRKSDGYMSTPMGIHTPISVEAFAERTRIWHERVQNTEFHCSDYRSILAQAGASDLVYLDPPYQDSQAIVYGAQKFDLKQLYEVVDILKDRGVFVALSIDGAKKSGAKQIELGVPAGLFVRELVIENGRSMLKRFQMEGQTLESEIVTERLLLTY